MDKVRLPVRKGESKGTSKRRKALEKRKVLGEKGNIQYYESQSNQDPRRW
jgi:hypothetical protein